MKTYTGRGGLFFWSFSKSFSLLGSAVIGLAMLGGAAPVRANPIIAATFDSNITSDPNTATVDTDNAFAEMNDDLSQSSANFPGKSHSAYLVDSEIEQTISPADTEFLGLTAPDPVDGGTIHLVHFNSNGIVDGSIFGNWTDGQSDNLPQAHDVDVTPPDPTNIGVSEMAALDVAGWNPTSASTISNVVPKVGSIGLLAASGVGLFVLQRRSAGR
jgi:hypothetical protein